MVAAAKAAEKEEEKAEPEAPPEPNQGEGSFRLPDKSTYQGEWIAVDRVKKRHGAGHYVDATDGAGGNSYDGEWKDDQMHGHGIFHFASGAKYEGRFDSNQFSGHGKYVFADGSVYEGAFADCQPHGAGSFTDVQGVVWEGKFYKGIGPGMPATGNVVAS